ncbi:MAG TPA: DMT family transporter [Xanthobacteraceae bacterium]|jgi:drug/metabolite transporter (DMT)-like permease|nr:DMT family transporter [Xanthobacteraceae bacterium]
MNVLTAIFIKIVSTALFAAMGALVRFIGDEVPVGQIVFFRSAFAIVPVVIIYAWRHELGAAVRTGRPLGHVLRGLISVAGMFLNFAALARLQLVDATAISFASPLITVALAAIVLKEKVRIYRWSAVAVGFLGVIVMLWPYLDASRFVAAGSAVATVGALCAIGSAFTNAGSVIQTRRLTDSETTSAIVFYFSLICAVAGLCTLPFGWHHPTMAELAALVSIGILGGLSHILLTESYRWAAASVVAPFDYTAMLWAFVLGYVFFGELPNAYIFVGALIVVASGLFVLWRERYLGVERVRTSAVEGPPVGE